MKKVLILTLLAVLCQFTWAQKTDYPLIGAQVFIEPGQSPELIESFFRTLKSSHMEVCRIRMFEGHMRQPDGNWDYSLYDTAFDAAEKYGIKVFATLFPATSITDIAGFRFPNSRRQFDAVENYMKHVVSHFKDKPALYAWVLQNEPGTSHSRISINNEFLKDRYAEFEYQNPNPSYNNDYLRVDFKNEAFLRHLTAWYLGWISSQVDKYDDKGHYKHVNPHQIFETLPEYDFKKYENFLTSLGASMHMSWHFGNFSRSQYPLGVAMMSDIIRPNAGKNPFWITELQGGNVTFSGMVPVCPTKEEIAQWLWTGISSGAEGIIFWTLNQRGTGKEAGEWGMIDFQGRPSDRLEMASDVIETVLDHKDFFSKATPTKADITLLYNVESFSVARWYNQKGDRPGRSDKAMMLSMIEAYDALSSKGISPAISDIENYDWNPEMAKGRAVVLTNVISLSSLQWERINDFVAGGGTLIATGLTGYYDEYAHCVMQTGFPLKEMFGGDLSEYKYIADRFEIKMDKPDVTLPVHMWKGIIYPYTSEVIGRDGDDVIATINRYGKGKAIWIPSMIELGARVTGDRSGLVKVLEDCLKEQISDQEFLFAEPETDLLMQTLASGKRRMTVFVNKGNEAVTVELINNTGLKPSRIFGQASINGKTLVIAPEDCSVFLWK